MSDSSYEDAWEDQASVFDDNNLGLTGNDNDDAILSLTNYAEKKWPDLASCSKRASDSDFGFSVHVELESNKDDDDVLMVADDTGSEMSDVDDDDTRRLVCHSSNDFVGRTRISRTCKSPDASTRPLVRYLTKDFAGESGLSSTDSRNFQCNAQNRVADITDADDTDSSANDNEPLIHSSDDFVEIPINTGDRSLADFTSDHQNRYSINDGGNDKRKQSKCCCKVCLLAISLSITIAVAIILVVVRYTKGNSYSTDANYGPSESHLLPLSRFLCQNLQLRSRYNGSSDYNVSLYMLHSHPGLYSHENVTISEQGLAEKEYRFFMHSGSKVAVNACFAANSAIIPFTGFYIVKESERYNGTYLTRSNMKSVVAEFAIYYDCKDVVELFTYYVNEDGYYNLIFQTSTPGYPVLNLNISMFISFSHYSLYNATILSSCTLSSSSNESECSISVPLYTTSYALLIIHPISSQVEWPDEISLETYCEPRFWVYIAPLPFILLLSIIVSLCLYGAWTSYNMKRLWRRMRKSICCKVLIFITLAEIITAVILVVLWSTVRASLGQSSFSPTETRLVPFSNSLCQSLSLTAKYNGTHEYNVSLHMLSSQPQLSKYKTFHISESITAEIEQHFLFYFNFGSEVTVSACFINSSVILPFTSFYIAKGIDGYDGGYLKSDMKSVVAEFGISGICSHGINQFSYTIEDSGFYYFIFHSGLLGTIPLLHLHVNMTFKASHYSEENTKASCNLSTSDYESTCSLGVPSFTTSYAILAVHPVSSEIDRWDTIPLSIHCKPRLSVYISPSFLLIPLLIFVSCGCYRSCKSAKCKKLHVYCLQKGSDCKNKVLTWWRKKRKQCYVLSYLILLIPIIISISLRFTKGMSFTNDGHMYRPFDRRVIPFSKSFCQSLSLKTNYNGPEEYALSFQLLPSHPKLDDYEIYTFSETVIAVVEHFNQFYMHTGSEVNVSACFVDRAAIIPSTSFYIVKGEYDGNGYPKSHGKSVEAELDVSYDCANNTNGPFSYSFKEDNYYYFIFHTRTPGVPVLHLNVNMTFNHTRYLKTSDAIINSCSLLSSHVGSSCSLDIPLSFDSYAFLIVNQVSSDVKWLDEISLETHCEPRFWVYILISGALVIPITIACCFCFLVKTDSGFKTMNCTCQMSLFIPYLVILLIPIFIEIGLGYTIGVRHFEKERYRPSEARVIPHNKVLCHGLKLKTSYRGTEEYNVSLEMLDSHPGLFAHESFSISDKEWGDIALHHQMYMHSGTEILVNACFVRSSAVIPLTGFYILKGRGYESKSIAISDVKSAVAGINIDDDCDNINQPYSYFVEEDDYYSMVFYTYSPDNPTLLLNFNISLVFTHYSLYNSSVFSYCMLSTSSYASECSVAVPLYTSSYALLTIHPVSSDMDIFDKVAIEVHCEPRLWFYFLFPGIPTFVFACVCSYYFFMRICARFKLFKGHNEVKRLLRYCKPYLLVFLLFAVIFIILHFTLGAFHFNNRHFKALETRLIPFHKPFCQGLRLTTSYDGSEEYNISLDIVSSHPNLFTLDKFSISEQVYAASDKHYLLYLLTGSVVTASACFINSTLVVPLTGFYIIKGISGYDQNFIGTGDIDLIVAWSAIYHDCSNIASYSVEEDDYYYLIFHTSTYGKPILDLNVNISISSARYSLNNTDTLGSCALSTLSYDSECSVSVPLYSTSYALLTTHPLSSDVKWSDEISLEINCELHLLVYILPVLFLFALCCTCYMSRKSTRCKKCYEKAMSMGSDFCKKFIPNLILFLHPLKEHIIEGYDCLKEPFAVFYDWLKLWTKKRKVRCLLTFFCIVMVLLLCSIFGLRFSSQGKSFSNKGQSYGPTDSRLVPFSNVFCQSLTLKTHYNGSSEYQLVINMLIYEPRLYYTENFTISEVVEAVVEKDYLFHMHSGSEVTVSACFVDSTVVVPQTKIYIIKGAHEYKVGHFNNKSKSVVLESENLHSCKTDISPLSYFVNDTDFYYVLLHTSTVGVPVLFLDVDMSLVRVQYAIYDNPILSSCSLSTSSHGSECSLSVPLHTSYALLTIHPLTSHVEWLDKISLETHCEPRYWLYVLPPLLFLFLLICTTCCCFFRDLSSKFKKFSSCSCIRKTAKGRVLFCYAFLAICLICIFGGLRLSSIGKSFSNDGQSYGPVDTRLIPFSKSLCQSLSLQTNFNGSNEYNVSLQILSLRPQLFGHKTLYVSEKIVAEVEQHYLIYMFPGSNISVSACFLDESVVVPSTKLYIVRGLDAYKGGHFDSKSRSIVAKSDVSYDCTTNNSALYSVEGEGFYYVIIQTDELGRRPSLHLDVDMSFFFTRYAPYDDPIVSSCTLHTSNFGSKCSLDIPAFTESYALLTIDPATSDIANSLDKIQLKTSCEPRFPLYILTPIAVFCLLILSACCFCVMKKYYKKLPHIWRSWKRKSTLGGVIFVLFFLIMLITILLGVRYTVGKSFSNSRHNFSPTESRLIPFSNIFCQSLSVKTTYNISDDYNISLYMLSSQPQVAVYEDFHFSGEIVTEVVQHYLFYMHSGSGVSITACFADSSSFVPSTKLYIVKGVGGYNGGYSKSDIKSVEVELNISHSCSESSTYYSVKEDDFYYIIFLASAIGTVPRLHLKVNLSLHLAQYEIVHFHEFVSDFCSLNLQSSCFFPLSVSNHSYSLLTIQPIFSDVAKLDEIPIDIHCDYRLWVYVAPPIALAIIVVCLVICYLKFLHKKIEHCISKYFERVAIATKFKQDWVKGTPPAVKKIYVIKSNVLQQQKWSVYRSSLSPPHTTVERYYHGTKLCCDILSTKLFCGNTNCGACRISETGFDRLRIRSNTFQRFGPGFYLAPNSSKANDYVHGAFGCKAIILCDVCPGKKYKLKKNSTGLHGPPNGYHSIYGERGANLNYDEIVLSNPDAILPRYIIVYDDSVPLEVDDIAKKFKQNWVKGTPPAVKMIYVVTSNTIQHRKWYSYKSSLGFFSAVEKHYYGTKLCCNILRTKQFCSNSDCGACRISETGFNQSRIQSNSLQHFGPGFYLAPKSSKADDYVHGAFGYKAIILCDVCPGKKYKLQRNCPRLNGPPHGYHSIYGERGASLSNDEIVLSDPGAILPRAIIIY